MGPSWLSVKKNEEEVKQNEKKKHIGIREKVESWRIAITQAQVWDVREVFDI